MNYTQITIDGRMVGIKFGMTATRLFFEQIEAGRNLMHGESVNEMGIAYLLWFGYVNNCEVKMMDPDLTLEDFYDYVEAVSMGGEGGDDVAKAMDVWAQSQPVQKAVEEAKKKLTGTE